LISRHIKRRLQNRYAFYAAVNLMIALREALKIIKEEGLDIIFDRHKKMALGVRNAMKAMGLELFSPDAYSDG